MNLGKGIIINLIFLIPVVVSGQITGFSLVNAVDKKEITLSSFSSKKAVVIVFTSNYCPYSKLYEDRLKSFHQQYSGKGVQLILINPNDPQSSKDDSIEEMAARAKKNGYSFPYLADKEQTISTQFGARKTPEVYVLKPAGDKFMVVYKGAIDDNPQIESDVSRSYLKEAVDAVLSGRTPATTKTNPTGCIIKN
jgi:peroxiredoxin